MTEFTISEKLSALQKALIVPKNRHNKFGNYSYRSCEDIIEAVKRTMPEGCCLNISDEIVMIGDRFYVKAKASFGYQDKQVSCEAYARESLEKKGMDAAQLTGSCSSYARKYALCGLFAIDDSEDADTMDNSANAKSHDSTVSTSQALELSQLIIDAKMDHKKFLAAYNIPFINSLPASLFNEANNRLKERITKLKDEFDQSDYLRA